MKKSLILLAALAVLGASPALAAKGDKWIGLQFGGSVPTGGFTNSARNGLEGGLAGTYMQSEHAGVGVDMVFHTWSGSDVANTQVESFWGPDAELKLDAIQATGHVLYEFLTGGPARPYAKAGCGLYVLETRLKTPFGNFRDKETTFGYNVGAGINFKVSPIRRVGIGGTYHLIRPGHSPTSLFTFGANLMWGGGGR